MKKDRLRDPSALKCLESLSKMSPYFFFVQRRICPSKSFQVVLLPVCANSTFKTHLDLAGISLAKVPKAEKAVYFF